MATKNITKKGGRRNVRKTIAGKAERFEKERSLEVDGMLNRVLFATWMKLDCDPITQCSRTRTCKNHLALLTREFDVSLHDPPFNVTGAGWGQIEKATCTYGKMKRAREVKEFVDKHPRIWPSQDAWEEIEGQIRECVSRIIETSSTRAADLGQLLRILTVTDRTPPNFQYKLAMIAEKEVDDFSAAFRRALAVGLSSEELYALGEAAD